MTQGSYTSKKRESIAPEVRCSVCEGYGYIWTNWGGRVACAHCHGEGVGIADGACDSLVCAAHKPAPRFSRSSVDMDGTGA